MNPFSPPNDNSPGPLCPWQSEIHLKYYVPVDHTEESFQNFRIKSQPWVVNVGRIGVLVTGDDGCGKSSLIHRCVMDFKNRIETTDTEKLWIVDLSQEKHPHGLDIEKKLRFSFGAIEDDAANSEEIFSEKDRGFIFQRQDDYTLMAKRLSKKLVDNKKTLILLAPRLELTAEISAYLDAYYRPGLVIFMESSEVSLEKFCTAYHGPGSQRPVLNLAVGKVAGKDGLIFKDARLSLLSNETTKRRLLLADSVIEEFLTNRTSGSFGLSVRELEKACEFAFNAAVQRGDSCVQYTDLANYYVRNAPR